MFIHLGGDLVMKTERIIAILDHQNQGMSKENQDFMKGYQGQKRTVHVTDDPPKSMVITADEIYMSPISSQTLKRRAEANNGGFELEDSEDEEIN
ncbi:extracellular matrix regulator RemB [Salisediminibacterium halotolerans]|nr:MULTISPECIES: extracellular matrix/biofilm biosynthesis regulator RemA family protein [Salisediminibacterium]RLJ69742.1 uncharacterized protein DUF370 [Actinophytocola xinjiangensis]RPE89800.1 uncharacterized protein DUF370 [Salisediminibacterium halotolerans]TWG32636.1 uncharacterized protein DUF370 [Salisediminibacterium halotolerans]GEL07552.1 DUF370 domain-containing protein [Salisediminibacterium halotolerans]